MLKRMVLAVICVLIPGISWAQTVQENYLPSKAQFYFRWDGMHAHQGEYDKTAVGKMMKGETGKFLDELWKWVNEQSNNAARNEPKFGPAVKDFTRLLGSMYQNGLIVGIQVEKVVPQPMVEAVLVFPKGAGESGTLLPLLQKIGEETNAKVKVQKVGKRLVHSVSTPAAGLGWWAQGEDAVLYLGTTDPVKYATAIDTKETGLAEHPLYKKVLAFKEFPTATRGYLDTESIFKLVSAAHPLAEPIVKELGFDGIKSVMFYSGFDGPGERGIVDVDMPSPRKGLLSLSSAKKMSLKDLPKLPNDLTGFAASTISLDKSYGVFTKTADGIIRIFDAENADAVKDAIKDFEGAAGVDINKDFFDCFGDVMVSYSSPSDGFLGTGAVVAIQLKDVKKFDKSLDKLIKAIPANPAGQAELKRKSYHGGEIIQVQLTGGQAHSHIATIGYYKNWLIYSSYPQPIKGFILRQEGTLPAWKASKSLTEALTPFPKEFSSIQVSDPRPSMQTLLSIAPFVMNLVNTFGSIQSPFGGPVIPGFQPFDLELIPHPQEATRHLFPNVTITIDDGSRIRSETRGSVLLPF